MRHPRPTTHDLMVLSVAIRPQERDYEMPIPWLMSLIGPPLTEQAIERAENLAARAFRAETRVAELEKVVERLESALGRAVEPRTLYGHNTTVSFVQPAARGPKPVKKAKKKARK
jgi:hypothetical protein